MPKVSEAHLRARREQILAAAAACFARDGFHRTSMQDIVRECGVSAGLVYRYFTSKDEMIAEIVRDWHTRRAELLTNSPAPAAPSASGMAENYLQLLAGIGTAEAPDVRLALQVWAETVYSSELRGIARDGVDQVRRAVRESVGDQLPDDVDPDALIRVLIAVYQGLFVQRAWDDTVDNTAYVGTVRTILDRLFQDPTC